MNADFEVELAHAGRGPYRRTHAYEALNRRLSALLLWLARPGDALLLAEPWAESLETEARRRGVELVSPAKGETQPCRVFSPWGWTPTAIEMGEKAGAVVRPVPSEVVRRVNSKLWSHALEVELGVALEGAATAGTFAELCEAAARACPGAEDKWVIKSP